MENRSHSYLTVLIALAFAVGLAGSGCKRARPGAGASAGVGAVGTGAAKASAASAVNGFGENLSANPDNSSAQAIPPSELARQELGSGQTTAPAKPTGPFCYVEAFHHKPTSDDTDEESSSHHGNLMTLAHAGVSSSHICVRVNGIPVKFTHKTDRKGDQILIGAVAGPTAKITVSYCVGKLTCPEVAAKDCTVPKDEFMDALSGGDSDDTLNGGNDGGKDDAQWEGSASDTQLNNDVKKELSDMDGMNTPEARGSGTRAPASMPVFKDWIEDQDAPACPRQAS